MGNVLFYIAAVVAIISTLMVITSYNAVHALLYLIVSLLSVAVIFYLVGAPFVAALEVIIYAGAIMTLFIFVIMMLNLGRAAVEREKSWLSLKAWIGPALLTFILLLPFLYAAFHVDMQLEAEVAIAPQEVGISLYTEYLLGVELAGILLLAGVVGAYHLGKKKKKIVHRYLENKEE